MTGSSTAPKYQLKVTAGSSYDTSTHQPVPVNEAQTLHIENGSAAADLCYPDNSPSTHSYFTHPLHQQDQYSISFAITFKHPVNSNDLIFGNNFDRPIRDRLPPGFNAALRLVQWTIDPALDGDAYADKPYLYSPAVATWNQFRIGRRANEPQHSDGGTVDLLPMHDIIVIEGGDGDGEGIRENAGIPATVMGRRAYFQKEEARKEFEFEPGRLYFADFGNRYLDFNDFSVRLPGFTINALSYIDEKTHYLRYVLKNQATDEIYLVVLFTLVLLPEEEREEKNVEEKGKSGRFEWETEPSADDVE